MSDDKMIFDEISERDNQVMQHLRYLYSTKSDDTQSLAHIRERLLRNSKEVLPVIASLKDTPEITDEGQKLSKPLPLTSPSSRRRRSSWSQRMLQLVAVLLVAALTGTFAIVLTLRSASSGGHTASFSVRSGWQQVAVYSGTGTSTLTGIKRSLPQVWASVVTCTGDDAVNLTLSGVGTESQGTDSCQSPFLTVSQPTSFSYNENSTVIIHTIKVTAHATTSWQVHLLQAINQPTFHLGAEWKTEGPTASGSGITFTRNAQDDKWLPQSTATMNKIGTSGGYTQTPTRTWGILTICFGRGKSYVQLSPAVGNLSLPICNGQPTLTVIRFPNPTTVQDMLVSANGDIIWNVGLVACTDETRCQLIPALNVTSKPS